MHRCPECDQACYCGGDCDDCQIDGSAEESGCGHCDGDDLFDDGDDLPSDGGSPMPDNPEFTAAQIEPLIYRLGLDEEIDRGGSPDKWLSAAMLRALATRLRAEEKRDGLTCLHCGKVRIGAAMNGACPCSFTQPAPDAGTGPLKIPDVIAPGTFMERGGYRQVKPADAGTGEAPTMAETVAELDLQADAFMAGVSYGQAHPATPSPVPDLAELLTDDFFSGCENAWAFAHSLSIEAGNGHDTANRAGKDARRAHAVNRLTPWLVSREAASRRRIEELTERAEQAEMMASAYNKAQANFCTRLDSAEAALAQLRREAQAVAEAVGKALSRPAEDNRQHPDDLALQTAPVAATGQLAPRSAR